VVAASAPVKDHVERIAALYLRHAKARTRASTWKETKRVFDREILPAWRGRRLSEIGKQDVRKLADGIAKRGAPVGANRLLASLKTFFAFAVEQDILTVSPALSVRAPAVEKARERTLTDDELAAVWHACAGLGGDYSAIIRLLLLTGSRRSEIANMDWNEIDLEKCLWTLPSERAKNNRMNVVPLSAAAVAILVERADLAARPHTSPYQTAPDQGPTKPDHTQPDLTRAHLTLPHPTAPEPQPCNAGRASATGPVFEPQSFSRMKLTLDAMLPAGMQPWVLHDLRRTAASGMAGLGTAPHVIEACLNHQSGIIRGVAAIYNRCRYEPEKREALTLWAQHVANLSQVPAIGSPVALSKAA
jgi:integrase